MKGHQNLKIVNGDNYHNKQFNQEDIRRYWSGDMSPAEMHALEKAAMDDPFLADAIEGYSLIEAEKVPADLSELKIKLNERVSRDRRNQPAGINRWWRIAAAVILLAGASMLTYTFLMNRSPNDVAQTKTAAPGGNANEKAANAETEALQSGDADEKSSNTPTDNIVNAGSANNRVGATDPAASSRDSGANNEALGGNQLYSKQESHRSAKTKNNSLPPASSAGRDNKLYSNERESTANKHTDDMAKVAEGKDDALTNAAKKEQPVSTASRMEESRNQAVIPAQSETTANARYRRDVSQNYILNNFSGRVVDQNNNAVPFASIRVNNNNQVASANNEGVFQIRSADSTLDLAVTSAGFQSRSLNLRANQPQDVMLQPVPHSKLSEVVVTKSTPKKTSAKKSDPELKVYVMNAEPEPGWEAYHAYIQNNRKKDTSILYNSGEVVVSFMVGRSGIPYDISIEKPLGIRENAEAIRIVQQGPKWKLLKGKRTRARVIVPF